MDKKENAARQAVDLVRTGMARGLGTGSTAKLFIDGVGELVRAGRKLVGVPTSQASRAQAEGLGIPLLGDDGPWHIDVTVDGADEVSERLDLIKGGGGAHAREKIVNHASRMNVIVVDDSKLSKQLGERWAVPVEVLEFGHAATRDVLARLGEVKLRLREGAPWKTDAGNLIYDLHMGVIADPAALERELGVIPGVVETGLFVGRAQRVIVAGPEGVRTLEPRS